MSQEDGVIAHRQVREPEVELVQLRHSFFLRPNIFGNQW